MSNRDVVNVDVDAIGGVVRTFEQRAKTGRTFFPEDSFFPLKYDSLIDAAGAIIKEKSGGNVIVEDASLHEKGDTPVAYSFGMGDAIALLDNSKIGFFGNIRKKECNAGTLITSKGILCYNIREGVPRFSGFVSWTTIANCTSFLAGGFVMGVTLFEQSRRKKYRAGPKVALIFENAQSKTLQRHLDEMIRHLKFIVKKCEGEFCNDDYIADDCEVEESLPE